MTSSTGEIVELDGGVELTNPDLGCPVDHLGMSLDFTLTSFNAPIGRKQLAERVEELANGGVQCIDVRIPGHHGFQGINITRVVDCLDESRSEYIKWTEEDHRADLAGQYRSVTRLRVDHARIPEGTHIFRIERWRIGVVVSEVMKEAMETAGSLGARFLDVT